MEERETDEQIEQQDDSAEENKDEKSISADLIRGHINTIILRSLADADKYGYEIIAEIERKSHGQYSLKQPSLYSALKRLEREGYITSYWGGSVGGGRRKYFSLTEEGQKIAEQNQSEWEYSRTIIDSLISDKDFDFSNPPPSLVNMRVLKNSTSRVPSREYGEEGEEEYVPEQYVEQDKLQAELEEARTELENQRAVLEEKNAQWEAERTAIMQEKRTVEEELRIVREREESLLREQETREKEILMRESIVEEERLRAEAKIDEYSAKDEQIRIQQQEREEERVRYEALLREQQEKQEQTRLHYEEELREQERRIRAEQEELFRRREQQLLHQNYLNLVNTPPPQESNTAFEYYTAPAAAAPSEPVQEKPAEENDYEYRRIIRKMYSETIANEEMEEKTQIQRARSLDGIDFDDIQSRAANDGIKIVTASTRGKTAEGRSENLVHKGKALFLSTLVVFLIAVAEGAIALALKRTYSIAVSIPYLMWAFALAVLLATGLAYANHYGERTLRRERPIILSSVISYILVMIVVLIIALGVNIDFTNPASLASYVIIPLIYFFSIVIFGIVYHLQVRPYNK